MRYPNPFKESHENQEQFFTRLLWNHVKQEGLETWYNPMRVFTEVQALMTFKDRGIVHARRGSSTSNLSEATAYHDGHSPISILRHQMRLPPSVVCAIANLALYDVEFYLDDKKIKDGDAIKSGLCKESLCQTFKEMYSIASVLSSISMRFMSSDKVYSVKTLEDGLERIQKHPERSQRKNSSDSLETSPGGNSICDILKRRMDKLQNPTYNHPTLRRKPVLTIVLAYSDVSASELNEVACHAEEQKDSQNRHIFKFAIVRAGKYRETDEKVQEGFVGNSHVKAFLLRWNLRGLSKEANKRDQGTGLRDAKTVSIHWALPVFCSLVGCLPFASMKWGRAAFDSFVSEFTRSSGLPSLEDWIKKNGSTFKLPVGYDQLPLDSRWFMPPIWDPSATSNTHWPNFQPRSAEAPLENHQTTPFPIPRTFEHHASQAFQAYANIAPHLNGSVHSDSHGHFVEHKNRNYHWTHPKDIDDLSEGFLNPEPPPVGRLHQRKSSPLDPTASNFVPKLRSDSHPSVFVK